MMRPLRNIPLWVCRDKTRDLYKRSTAKNHNGSTPFLFGFPMEIVYGYKAAYMGTFVFVWVCGII